ncbi:MAG: excinuclease subunit [Actinomycetota bacterium]|jgi:excinuclease ABC subunit C
MTVVRPPAGTIPDSPGSYQFKDRDGRIIYVGKAASLRQRLNNYFGDPALMFPRTAQMVTTATSVEWIQVDTELEALLLEFSLIQRYQPRFNVRLRDDKSYPYLAVTLDQEWPRAMVMRGARRKGVRYFGPYGQAYAIRETLDLLLRTFPIRTCSDNKLERHRRSGRPCLLFHIEQCSGPCVGEVTPEAYATMVRELCQFLDGDTDPVTKRLELAMLEASDKQEYERAARLRDRLAAVNKAIAKQQVVTTAPEDFDILGIAQDELEAAVQVFYVRRGRVVGRKGIMVDKVEELTPGDLVGRIIERLYYDPPPLGVPRQILVPTMPDDLDLYQAWLSALREGPVTIRMPQRGDKRALQETVTRNAMDEFQRSRIKRASDYNSRAEALNELQTHLQLPETPLRIECFDMSHIQGTDYVGSMVVMEDGLPRKSEYRRFKVKQVGGNDDYAAMEEVLTRRFKALIAERARPLEKGQKFVYPPQLLLVDGGKGQLGVAMRVLEDLGLDDEIPVASLAKQFEEVYVPGQSAPIRIPRQSEALYLLQRVRDEAHRFAITYHRQLRNKRMTKSVLDDIPGLGPNRKKRLTDAMGGVRAVQNASREDLGALSFLPDAVADAVYDKLHRRG